MPDLRFEVVGARAVRSPLAPAVALELRVENAGEETIQAALLRCQVSIDAARRRYSPAEAARLDDLFGDRSRWGETLKPLLWAQVSVQLPGFTGSSRSEVAIPCPQDLALGPARYVRALEGGEVPIALAFTGTVFYEDQGGVQVELLPWDREARHRLPLSLLLELTVPSRPGETAISLRPDVFSRLERWRSRHGFPDWERALESLLPPEEAT
jgi:hypothetical protein